MTAGGRGRSLYLIGFMGVGKSTLGPAVAGRLGWPFVDLDVAVERAMGQSVGDIWTQHGEAGFRDMESLCLQDFAGSEAVIATGGGSTIRARSREIMVTSGLVLWLRAPFEVIWERVRQDHARVRPLCRDEESLRALFEARLATYTFAHEVLDVAGERADVLIPAIVSLARGAERGS